MLDLKKIPSNIGHYIAGFADGEASFMVIFRPRKDYKNNWKISLAFNISQKDPTILSLIKRYLKCGILRQRKDGVWYYEVNNMNSIEQNIIPFFTKYGFLSSKKKTEFSNFKRIFKILKKDILTIDDIKEILRLRKKITSRIKYSDDEILKTWKA